MIAWHLGKRTKNDTILFAEKLRRVTLGRFQLSTDGYNFYPNAIQGAFDIYPESETNFFVRANSPHELTFVNNDKGEVTAVIVRFPGIAIREGKKLKNK